MRILMPSIVDPAEKRGGAWAVTSGLMSAMEIAWPGCHIECVATPSSGRQRHRVRRAISVIASLVRRDLPAKMRFQRTASLRRRVRAALAAKPDLIVLNGGDLLWLLPELPAGVPTIVVAHNLEHVLYQRQIANIEIAPEAVARVMRQDGELLRAMELDGLRSVSAAIFLSTEDLAAVRNAIGEIDAVVIPPSFDYAPLPRSRQVGDRLSLGMFADFKWWPNRRGLDWFLARVWPHVAHRCDLHLIGHGSDDAARGVPGITRHGFVNEARDAFAGFDLMIAPITDGGGIKVKVAEALYNGVPVVATPAAVSSTFGGANPALKICANESEWISFLSGPEAERLSREEVPTEVRDAFTTASAARLISSLVLS